MRFNEFDEAQRVLSHKMEERETSVVQIKLVDPRLMIISHELARRLPDLQPKSFNGKKQEYNKTVHGRASAGRCRMQFQSKGFLRYD